MKTTRLYQKDRYIKEWDAEITSVVQDRENDTFIVTLDKSAFFPEGGGQSCDLGVIGGRSVTDVQENDGEVFHTLAACSEHDANNTAHNTKPPAVGDTVRCMLDWDRRFDNMQRHCGEHILSGIFYALFGGVNRGFHMGHDYMTIDISLEANPDIKELTYEDALNAELEANKVIWSDAPVTVMHFESRSEAEKMPLRKALAFDEDITIVSIGSPDNAADCVACCGTHPSSAGQVGLIKIYKIESYKGMFRIYFDAGKRALCSFRKKHDMLTELSNRYSSSIDDFPANLRAQEEKLSEVKNELFHIKKAFIDNECMKLDKLLEEVPDNVIIYKVAQLSLDDVFNMAKRYMGGCQKLIMLYCIKDFSYILVSDGSVDCGSLVKDYASFYKGKGGGNKVSARAIFTAEDDASMFADLVCKHLKNG